MAIPNPLTTRWIRLQRGADQAAADAEAIAGSQEPVTPFGIQTGAAPSPIRVESATEDEDFGLERLVLIGWRAFFKISMIV